MSTRSYDEPLPGDASVHARAWLIVGLGMVVSVVVIGIAFQSTWRALGAFWYEIATYSHVYLVGPIAAYFAWRQVPVAMRRAPVVRPLAIAGVAGLSLLWLASRLVSVEVGEQVAVVLLVPACLAAIAGWRALLVFWFPVAYFMLVVPIWTELTPLLQDLTANAAAASLQFFGIPVFHEGRYLTIPNGQFVVAEVCSGLRYLLATMSIAGLHAYMNIRRFWPGVAFFVFAVGLSILFNWIRVDAIVLAGHYGGMGHFLVGQHVGLGWVLFATALVPLFVVGRVLEADLDADDPVAPDGQPADSRRFAARHAWVLLPVAAAVALGPALEWRLAAAGEAANPVALTAPPAPVGWQGPTQWTTGPIPAFVAPGGELRVRYQAPGAEVGLYVAAYRQQAQGRELANPDNRLFPTVAWSRRGAARRMLERASARPIAVSELELQGPRGGRWLMWRFNRVGGAFVEGRIATKLAHLVGLVEGDPSAYAFVLATPIDGDHRAARARLSTLGAAVAPLRATD